MRSHLGQQLELYGQGPHGEVFANEVGGPLRRGLFCTRIWRPWLITAGVPVPDVQKVMGHESPTTTLAIYTHVQTSLQNRVLGALAAFSLPQTPDGTHENL